MPTNILREDLHNGERIGGWVGDKYLQQQGKNKKEVEVEDEEEWGRKERRREGGRAEGKEGGMNGGREKEEKEGRKLSDTRKEKNLLHATKPNAQQDFHGHSNISSDMWVQPREASPR